MNAFECAENAEEVFILSDSFSRIKELIDNDSSTIDDIAEIIILDPTLSVTILKLANSSFFNYPGKIETISKAVLVLGITEVYNLIIAYFITDAFKSIEGKPEYLESFWEQAVDCALIIKFLGTELNIPNAERLFILGLLHNIGELAVHQSMPAKIEACNTYTPDELPWDKQKSEIGFTYGECSGDLLKQWQLPYTLIEPIREQDQYDFEFATIETKLLYLSKRVMLLNYGCNKHKPSSLITAELLIDLKVNPKMILAANHFCNVDRLGILSILSPGSSVIF
ncbi:HDOD domain-containing protein [Pseudocolwellia sp. AS88]|uniref:HDOD domain-containing protein n=1 Tax=Pseudocolwellia sp. AS88 TaxID=3063958 RepID=UPI0026F297AE|nr:HDOD domain-containing protein [Pseudocolwellia sp. AS88]MDO7084341.1 HDOD domain-containing protein [Pseudocolwellia sp. AS88]